ncbi:hypothetical protein BKA65DRAFT_555438 [Rhexocercosporidium sp. MPI-PUGE-AT-0058]|nr:hypothetical protein BKA65DRAFT_555438 [Rhexocercosporidium sp. MPI-PUGE-AT-0058]
MYFTTLASHSMLLTLTILPLISTSVLAAPASTSNENQATEGLGIDVVRGVALPPGYKYKPLRMTGTIGGITLNHTGTIEEILAKVVDENPGFRVEEMDSTSITAEGGHGLASRDKVGTRTIYQRTKENLQRIQEDQANHNPPSTGNQIRPRMFPLPGQPDWRAAEVRYINDGVAYLKKVNALCGVNGHACSRISCSYKSAITLCNVTPNHMSLSCTYMASYIQDILNRCAYSVGLIRLVGGQAWDTDGYNVNVMRDTSC